MENKNSNILLKSVRICGYQFQNQFISAKTLVIYAVLLMVISAHLRPVADFCIDQGIYITPWIFPFMSSDYMLQVILIAGVVILIADIPFKNENQMYLIYRSGMIGWQLGIILYLLSVAVIYVLSIWGMALISLTDVVKFDWEWGKIIGTLTQRPLIAADYAIPMQFTYTIFQFTPLQATVYSLLLEMGCVAWIGLVVYVGNDFLRHHMGIIFAFVYLFLDVMIYNVMSRAMYRYSPLSICQLGYFDGDMRRAGITLAYAVKFFCVSISGFTLFILGAGNRKRIGRYLMIKRKSRNEKCN